MDEVINKEKRSSIINTTIENEIIKFKRVMNMDIDIDEGKRYSNIGFNAERIKALK